MKETTKPEIMRSGKQLQFMFWAYAFLMACLFLLLRGYMFNTGDQSEHLPPVYQLIRPDLYPSDFYMQGYNATFTMRYFYVQLVYGLSFIAPIPVICFVLNLFFLTLSAYSWMKITSAFSGYLISAFLTPLLVLFVFFQFTVGGNHIQYNEFDCGNIAQALASAGLLFFLRSRWFTSALLLGLATLFQVLVGFQLFLLLAGFILLHVNKFRWKNTGLFITSYILIAAFILVPMLKKQFMSTMEYDKDLYTHILYHFRNPLHFIPALFPIGDFIKYALLVISALVILVFKKLRGRRFILTFILLHITGLVVYTVAIELFGVFEMAKIQWYKTTIWVSSLCGVVISIWLGRLLVSMISARPFPGWLLKPLPATLSLIGSAVCLFVILNSAQVPFDKAQGRYRIGNYKKSDLTLMHEWINDNLPVDAIILISPANESFGCEARRSSPVSWKAIVHEPSFMFPWYKRVNLLYNTSLENLDGNTAAGRASMMYNTVPVTDTTYRIDYRLDNVNECTFADKLGKVVYRSGNYILTKM